MLMIGQRKAVIFISSTKLTSLILIILNSITESIANEGYTLSLYFEEEEGLRDKVSKK